MALTPFSLFGLIHALGEHRWSVVALEIVRLVFVCGTLFLPFLGGGTALSLIFAANSDHVGKLYAADLAGAAIGCALVVPLLVTFGPPGTVCIAGGLLAAAGLRLAGPRLRAAGALIALGGLVAGGVFPGRLPDPVPDQIKNQSPTIFTRWHPVFRVDVAPVRGVTPPTHILVHDGTPGSAPRA